MAQAGPLNVRCIQSFAPPMNLSASASNAPAMRSPEAALLPAGAGRSQLSRWAERIVECKVAESRLVARAAHVRHTRSEELRRHCTGQDPGVALFWIGEKGNGARALQ